MKPMNAALRWSLAAVLSAAACAAAAQQAITMASTTSTEQSGLFAHLLPEFKKASGIDIKVVALGTGQVGILLGLGDHTTAVLALTRAIGVFLIAILVSWLLLAVLRGRLHPVGGLGVALGGTILLFPVVQPWYLLWAVLPLAACLPAGRWRTRVAVVVGVFALLAPPLAGNFAGRVTELVLAYALGIALVGCAYFVLRRVPVAVQN